MISDRFGRPITSMRISITKRCNLNCIYCHREGVSESLSEMTPDEIARIVKLCAKYGVGKVKITGGEPLVRSDVCEIVEGISEVEGIGEVSMTTNGILLEGYAADLKKAGLSRVNISLDTLKPKIFEEITRGGELKKVLAGIEKSLEVGLKPVKLNMVLMKGVNEKEISDVMKFCRGPDVVLQLIELVASEPEFFKKYFYDLDGVEKQLEKEAKSVITRKLMHGRRKYLLNGMQVEVVKPMHNTEFCAHCTRIRITPDGKFKPCLMRTDNHVDFLTEMRSGASDSRIEELFKEAIQRREPYFKRSN